MAFLSLSGVRCAIPFQSPVASPPSTHNKTRKKKVAQTFWARATHLCWPLQASATYYHMTLASSMPSVRRVKVLGALIACSLLLVALSVVRPECYNDDNKRCTAVEEINMLFGFASLMLLLVVGATWPLIVLIAVLTALCCHCRHRKKRINYNPIAMITTDERKERAKQYMAHGAV